ncbi:MAG: hypothetical protein EB015_22905, partial [Methylocystaceae bacterium]|nr:hypothetical protein [Methylocystaceae bacterium]
NADQKDEIALEALKDAYRLNCMPDKYDCSDETIDPDYEFLNALDLVINYFTNNDQFQEWIVEKMDLREKK